MQNGKKELKEKFQSRLYQWALRLVRFLETLPKDLASGVIAKQLLRSGTSVLANYIESSAASSRKDYTNFFSYSLKSANESRIWLSLLKDTGKGAVDELAWLQKELEEIANILASSIITLKGKQ